MGFFDGLTDFLAPVTDFISDNEALINIGVSAGTAYYAYDQQQKAIEASERAQNQAIALQREQIERENQMNRLQKPTSNASQIDLFNQKTRMRLNDFMYEAVNTVSDRTDVGLGHTDVKKAIGVA